MRCRKYRYIITSKSDELKLLLGGVLTFINPETASTASEFAIREAAASAQETNIPFDPFNLTVIVTPIGRIYHKQT